MEPKTLETSSKLSHLAQKIEAMPLVEVVLGAGDEVGVEDVVEGEEDHRQEDLLSEEDQDHSHHCLLHVDLQEVDHH